MNNAGMAPPLHVVGGAAAVTRIAPILNTALVILLSYTLAEFSWQPFGDSAETGPVVLLDSSTGVPPQSAVSLSEVAGYHLLGEVGQIESEPAPRSVDAPETQLNLKLKGLFAVDEPELAMAIISVNGRNEASYQVGQNVGGAAIVDQIQPDRVILKRGDRYETLTLPKERLPENATNASSTRLNRQSTSGRIRSLPGLHDRILRNPQQALSLVNARPVMEGGQLKGYRVRPGRERALFARAGLRPNDVVTQVNGISLADTSQLGSLMQEFRRSGRVDVTVERGGRPITLSLDLD